MYYQVEKQPYIPMSDPYSTVMSDPYSSAKKIKLPSMFDMCYLSGKIYEDPKKDLSLQCRLPEKEEIFKNCSSLQHDWQIKFGVYKSGLQMALYFNDYYKCSVMAIRGTEPKVINTLLADYDYFTNNSAMPMFDAALDFYIALKTRKNAFLSEYPLVACTGHSLGGILAKMLAPITRLSTYTFNSPGVLQILKALIHHYQRPQYVLGVPIRDTMNEKTYMLLTERGALKRLMPRQEVLTYIANGDVVGNFNRDHDIGQHIHIPVLNSARIDYTRAKDYTSSAEAREYLANNLLTYHGIIELFNHLKTIGTPEKHENRIISYV